jgi:HK97 family phage portal protein
MVREFMSGTDYNPDGDVAVSGNSSLKFSAVFACLRVLAETFASVPIAEYKKLKNGDREKTDDTGLYDILHAAPNDEMSAYAMKEMAMYQINLGGNVVCERLVNGAGKIVGLYPYEWDRVAIERDKETKKIAYKIDGKDDQKRTRAQVFHVAGPSINGVVGMSPIEYASNAIRLGLTYEKFSNTFYKNGAMPTGVFEVPGFLKDESYKRLKDNLKENWTGLKNTGTPILCEDGMKYNPLTMKLVDAELLESKKFQIEDICRIYRVPLHLVQNLDKATNNNIEHQSLEFVMYTMLPWFKRWEEAINCQLLTRAQRTAGYYLEFNVNSLLRGDSKSMADAFAVGRQWGWLSVNDIRRLMNMNSIENGDVYLQPMNMIEAGTVPAASPTVRAEIEKLIASKG